MTTDFFFFFPSVDRFLERTEVVQFFVDQNHQPEVTCSEERLSLSRHPKRGSLPRELKLSIQGLSEVVRLGLDEELRCRFEWYDGWGHQL
jgi:hypothetical protein